MQDRSDYEKTINYKKMILHVLYKWRSILLAAVIMAVLFAGYQYISVETVHSQGKLTSEEHQYKLDEQAYYEDVESASRQIQITRTRIQQLKEYKDKSAYMQMDPSHTCTITCRYIVKAKVTPENQEEWERMDPVDTVLPAYLYPLYGATDEETKAAFGIENLDYINEIMGVTTNTTENSVNVWIKAQTKEQAVKAMTYIQGRLESRTQDAQKIEPHELIRIQETTIEETDRNMINRQADLTNKIIEYTRSNQEAKKWLNELETRGEPKQPGTHIIKYAVIGAGTGLLLMIIFHALAYMLNGKLESSKELNEEYGLQIFGDVWKSESNRRKKGIDKLIYRAESSNNVSEQDEYASIKALLKQKINGAKVALASTLPTEKLEQLKQRLGMGEEVEAIGTFFEKDGTIRAAKQADMVIIVEEKGVSGNDAIRDMINLLKIAKANIIGAITI